MNFLSTMYIKVVVKAGMKKESIKQTSVDHFEISVREKAERNMANKRVIELIANYYKIQTKRVRIINGHHHSHKLLIAELLKVYSLKKK